MAVFDDLVYGSPLMTGYQPGEITFGLGAIVPNLQYMPAHLMQAMPMLVRGLAALAWIIVRWLVLRPAAIWGRPGPGRVMVGGLGPLLRVLLDE